MKISTVVIAAALLGAAAAPAFSAPATSQTASMGLSSTMSKGIVSVMTEPVLMNGALVLKVAAHNPTSEPQTLSVDNVHVFTAAGKAVGIVPLDQLIAGVKGSGQPGSLEGSHQSSNYSRPQPSTSRTGEMDVTGITGASDSIGRTVSEQPRSSRNSADDPAVQQQIDALKAGILQTVTIKPGTASGGQIVTEKIKFSRKEERVLRVVVDFNGEQHEFSFEAPPAK